MAEIPAIIQDMVKNLFNPGNSIWIKNNYKNSLMDVQNVVNQALEKFEKEERKSYGKSSNNN